MFNRFLNYIFTQDIRLEDDKIKISKPINQSHVKSIVQLMAGKDFKDGDSPNYPLKMVYSSFMTVVEKHIFMPVESNNSNYTKLD